MNAEERIDQLHHNMWSALLKGHGRKAFAFWRQKEDFKNFAQKLAKQRVILDGHDFVLEPDAWVNYVFDVTVEEYEDYLHARIQRKTENQSAS